MGAVLGVFLLYGRSGIDWEIVQTKHYWDAQTWYYGGYAAQAFPTPKGYRTVIAEGLCNYTNLYALREQVPASAATHPVQGFPGTERLATPFLIYVLLHGAIPGTNPWSVFWVANILLWLVTVILAFKVAGLFFPDRCAPWFAAILVALYPALTLTFNAVKQQGLGTTFLLFGIYLFEGPLRGARFSHRLAALTAALFCGQFADGGWFFLAAFIFFRAWWLPGRRKWENLLCLGGAFVLSEVWFSRIRSLYHLPSASRSLGFGYGRILTESLTWLHAWISGASVDARSFLNYPGFTFFTGFWPLICKEFMLVHGPLLLLAIAGLLAVPRTRMFTLICVPMLFLGHAGMILAGWIFYYGYLSFPAAVMLILAAAGVLGRLAESKSWFPRTASILLLAIACTGFANQKMQVGIYYGGDPDAYMRHVEVHYGNEPGHVDY